MNKRTFIKTLGAGMVAAPLTGVTLPVLPRRAPQSFWPHTLKKGDVVGVITPSSPVMDEADYGRAEENLQNLGLRLKWGAHVGKRLGFLAGTDAERLADLEGMFLDPEVKAIVCLRGGLGAARLLDKLDYGLIARHPKIFLGYSDITAFHQAIYSQTGLVTFHGAVANSLWTPMVLEQMERLFFAGESPVYRHEPTQFRTLTGGIAAGKLLGGNLTVLTGIAGSPYFPEFDESILFLEDVGEQPYRVDRMLSQLVLTGTLSKVKAVVFGQCTDCEAKRTDYSLTVDQLVDHYFAPLGVPAFTGALIGHIAEQYIMPVGARVRIDADQGEINVLGKLVQP